MGRYIPKKDRDFVFRRAQSICEYCLLHQDDAFFTFHLDHIISLKHGGKHSTDNLCLACLYCNANKSSDIGTILQPGDRFVGLYHPRKHHWAEHFKLNGSSILSLTEIGEATEKVLGLNQADRIAEREILIRLHRYPPEQAAPLLKLNFDS